MQVSKWVTLCVGMICLIIVAAVLNAQHLYYMAAILLTLPCVSYVLGWYTLRGLTFTREQPESAWAGEEGSLVYTVRNSTPVPRFFLSIQEPLPRWITPAETSQPLFNARGVRHSNTVTPSSGEPDSGSGESDGVTRVANRVRFQRRGAYMLTYFEVTAMDPLGVFAFTRRIPCETELVVYPAPQPLQTFDLSGADRYGWQEFTAAALRGGSADADGVREYAPGDSLRRIHWRQTARTNRLAVIEFEEPRSINVVLVLDLLRDTEAGQGIDTTLETAVRFASSLAHEAIQAGAGVRLVLPDDILQETDAAAFRKAALTGRGSQHLMSVLEALARVQARSVFSLPRVVTESVGILVPGTTLVVITAAADAGLGDALARYTALGIRTGVIYVDPTGYPGRQPHAVNTDSADFYEGLLSAQADVFVLNYNARQKLMPEAVTPCAVRAS